MQLIVFYCKSVTVASQPAVYALQLTQSVQLLPVSQLALPPIIIASPLHLKARWAVINHYK